MNATIDIVIITYNSAKYVTDTLDSIYKQTYPSIRLLVSDDCSKDNTIAICKNWISHHKERFIDTVILEATQNQGTVFNCQKAFTYVQSAYYVIIAGDDYFAPNYVEKCLAKYDEIPNAGFVFTSSNLVYEIDGRIEKEDISKFREGDIFEDLLLLNFWPKSGSFMLRMEAMRNVGGYNTDIWVEDFDYALRLSQKYPIGWVPDYLMNYRLHDSNAGGESIRLLSALLTTITSYSAHPKYVEAKKRLETRLISVAKQENPTFLLRMAIQKRNRIYFDAYLHTLGHKIKQHLCAK